MNFLPTNPWEYTIWRCQDIFTRGILTFVCDCCWCYWENFGGPNLHSHPKLKAAVRPWKLMRGKGNSVWVSGRTVKPSWMSLTPEIQTRTSIPPLDRGGGSRLFTRIFFKSWSSKSEKDLLRTYIQRCGISEFTNDNLLRIYVCRNDVLHRSFSLFKSLLQKQQTWYTNRPAECLKSQNDQWPLKKTQSSKKLPRSSTA